MTPTRLTNAHLGAGCLIGGTALGLVSVLVRHTVSESSAVEATALAAHHDAMLAGVALSSIAVLLWIGGVVWLAFALRSVASRSVLVGATMGVIGNAAVLFGNGITAAAYGAVHGVGSTAATGLLDRMGSAGDIADPFALLGDIAFVVLAIDAVRVGVPRWAAVVTAVGALTEGAGFGLGERAVALTGFVLLLVGLSELCRIVLRVERAPVRAGSLSSAHGAVTAET